MDVLESGLKSMDTKMKLLSIDPSREREITNWPCDRAIEGLVAPGHPWFGSPSADGFNGYLTPCSMVASTQYLGSHAPKRKHGKHGQAQKPVEI